MTREETRSVRETLRTSSIDWTEKLTPAQALRAGVSAQDRVIEALRHYNLQFEDDPRKRALFNPPS